MYHHICSVCKRMDQIRCSSGAVDDQRNPMSMYQFRNRFQVYYVQLRISDQFRKDHLGVLVDQRFDLLYRDRFCKACGNAKRFQVRKQINGSAEQSRTGDHFISRMENVQKCHCHCRHAGRTADCSDAVFHCGYPLFKSIYCGIADSRICKSRCLIVKNFL